MTRLLKLILGCCVLLAAGIVGGAGTDAVFQRTGSDGVIELTNVPGGEGYKLVVSAAAASSSTPMAMGTSAPAAVSSPAVARPPNAASSPDAASAPAPPKFPPSMPAQGDVLEPTRDGAVVDRMQSLYRDARAAREAASQNRNAGR